MGVTGWSMPDLFWVNMDLYWVQQLEENCVQ